MSAQVAKNARELLLKEYRGALSTLSKAMPGFPFGSVVPYCLEEQGRPLILISRIAQHTHNLQKDPKCSLLVGEREADDVQAVGRLTYLAEAEKLMLDRRSNPSGLLKISTPSLFGRKVVMPVIGELTLRYPELRIEAVMTDRLVDIVDEERTSVV